MFMPVFSIFVIRIGVGDETGGVESEVNNGSDVFVINNSVMRVWCEVSAPPADTDQSLTLDTCLWYRPNTDR